MRTRARTVRAQCDPSASAQVTDHALRYLRDHVGAVVGAYWPIRDELDITPLLFALHRRRHCVGLPVTPDRGKPLLFRRWRPGVAMTEEAFGTFCPDGPECDPDILLVPVLAFDRRGRRLGYGGGYYDRTLAAMPRVIALGVAYAAQEVDEVPAASHDRTLHAVITEHGVIMTRTRHARAVSRRRDGAERA